MKKAYTIYEFIISFLIFLFMAILLFKTLIDIGPQNTEIFTRNSACLNSEKLLSYITTRQGEYNPLNKLGFAYGIRLLNYSKWEEMRSFEYIDIKQNCNIDYPFKINYLVKEIPFGNYRDNEPLNYPNESVTSANLIRNLTNMKIYVGSENNSAHFYLILKTHNDSSSISKNINPCITPNGELESEDSVSVENGKVIIKFNISAGDLDCVNLTFNESGGYIYIDYIDFSDKNGEDLNSIYLSDEFKLNDEFGSMSSDIQGSCKKETYVIMNYQGQEFVSKMGVSSW